MVQTLQLPSDPLCFPFQSQRHGFLYVRAMNVETLLINHLSGGFYSTDRHTTEKGQLLPVEHKTLLLSFMQCRCNLPGKIPTFFRKKSLIHSLSLKQRYCPAPHLLAPCWDLVQVHRKESGLLAASWLPVLLCGVLMEPTGAEAREPIELSLLRHINFYN